MSDADDLLCHLQSLARRYRRQLGPELAADLAAEALVRALRRPPPDGRFGPWLERILHNLVVDHWRRAARPLEAPAGEPPATPEDVALARERRRHLERSLARLSPEVRRSLLHRYAEGRGGAAGSTGRTRVHRGLCRLRELMKGLGSFLPPFGQGALAAQAAVVTVFLAQQSPAPPVAPPRPTAHAPAPRAHTPPAPPPPAVAPQPKPPAPRRYDFEDDEVVGDLQRPLGDLDFARARPARHPSLIEIPDSFTANVIKSVEDL